MKIRGNIEELQDTIYGYCNSNEQFKRLFINKGYTIEEIFPPLQKNQYTDDDVYISPDLNSAIAVDSTIAYFISDYYKIIGDSLNRIENITGQPPKEIYNYSERQNDLGIVFCEEYQKFVSKEFSKFIKETVH